MNNHAIAAELHSHGLTVAELKADNLAEIHAVAGSTTEVEAVLAIMATLA